MSGNYSSILLNSSVFRSLEVQVGAATGLSGIYSDVVLAALVFTASVVLAVVVKFLVATVAPKLVRHTKNSLDDELIKAVNGPLQLFIVSLGAYVAIMVIEAVTGLPDLWVDRLSLVGVVFIFAYLLANVVRALLTWYRKDIAPQTESDVDDMLVPFLQKVLTAAIAVIAILVALEQLNIIAVTPLITGMGIVGIAVALAAQELLSNFVGSVSILADRPYKVGDRVIISGIDKGDIVDIGLRSTRLKTLDSRMVIVPNAKVAKSVIVNTALPDTCICYDVNVGISYDADVDRAMNIMKEVARGAEGVLAEPAPAVYVTELGNFAIKLLMHVYLQTYQNMADVKTLDQIYKGILKRFEAEGIEIPYPIQKVIVKRDAQGLPVIEPVINVQARSREP